MQFVDNFYSQVNFMQYLKHNPSLAVYMRNLIIDNNIMRASSALNGPQMDEIKNIHLSNISMNAFPYKSNEIEFNDEFNKYIIESAIAGIYDGVKMNINSWYENNENNLIIDSYSNIDLGKASGRNRFLLQVPELIRSFVELSEMARTDKSRSKVLLKELIAVNKWAGFGDTEINALLDNMGDDTFIKNIELFGNGVGKSVQYFSQEFGENDSPKLVKQRNDLSLYPKEFQEILAIFNVMKFGYRGKKTFYDVIGPKIYGLIDEYVQKNVDKIFAGKENFLKSMYSMTKGLNYGTEITKEGVIMKDYVKKININPGKVGNDFGTTPVHVHRTPVYDDDKMTIKDVVLFNKFAGIGGNYKVNTTMDEEVSTEMMVVKTLGAEELGTFLKYGSVTISNLNNNYPAYVTKDNKAIQVVYLVSNIPAYAISSGDQLTFSKIEGQTLETLAGDIRATRIVIDPTNPNKLLQEKRAEKVNDPNSIVYENTEFYDPTIKESDIKKQ
jgi:hypothetical protein